MGWSCSALANIALENLISALQNGKSDSSNTWSVNGKTYFYELGREHIDGDITGSVWQFTDESHAVKVGSFKISDEGIVQRFPTSTKSQRDKASRSAVHKFIKLYGFPYVSKDHPGADLARSHFVIV